MQRHTCPDKPALEGIYASGVQAHGHPFAGMPIANQVFGSLPFSSFSIPEPPQQDDDEAGQQTTKYSDEQGREVIGHGPTLDG